MVRGLGFDVALGGFVKLVTNFFSVASTSIIENDASESLLESSDGSDSASLAFTFLSSFSKAQRYFSKYFFLADLDLVMAFNSFWHALDENFPFIFFLLLFPLGRNVPDALA